MQSPALRYIKPFNLLPIPANSVLWFPGQDDAYSATIRDRSGNKNNGAISGATWKRNSQGLWYLFFDGAGAADDIVTVTDAASIQNIFASGGFFEAWINPGSDGESDLGRLFDKRAAGIGWYVCALSEAAGKVKLRFAIKFSTAEGLWATTATAVALNTWSHIMLTYNSGNVANNPILYVNGVSIELLRIAPVGTVSSDAAINLYIGSEVSTAATFDGGIALPILGTGTPPATGSYLRNKHLFGV